MTILDGKKVSEDIKNEIAAEVQKMRDNNEKVPHLAAVIVGNDGASLTYVGSKVKACERVGFESTLIKLPSTTSETELLIKIKELNENDDIDGFIVQLPLPKQIDTQEVLMAIDPSKDVDGFHPENFGKMALDMSTFIPATPFGILELLERYNVETAGKHTVVIGRSHIVGRPMSILMGRKGFPGNSTVTLTHSHTKNINQITSQADIIITALGVPNYLKAEMIKDDAVIIDVGITRVEDLTTEKGYRITGDVDFENVSKKASFITPVPGGVGPMTIAMLLKNTLLAREQKRLKKQKMIIEVIAKNDLHIVKDLAYKIWPSAYAQILSQEQLAYMLEKFYSKEALEKQMIERNHVFLVIKQNNIPYGFASYELNCENNQKAKLHKIYVLPDLQQKGIGKLLLQEVENRAKNANCKSIFLNVNRYNKAQEFYKKYNYIITKQEDISIGNGYLMEDYVMEKQL